MCAIAGLISQAASGSEAIVQRMVRAMAHRGPDGEGVSAGDGFVFGHRRLAILDLSDEGRQPMSYLDRYLITFNGEIFNYIELRNELASLGYTFRSRTDTEVIMAAYDRWGADCLRRFNGMWAFAIYDRLTRHFFMARDRFGIKPFYYYFNGKLFIFASEIKALFQHPAVPRTPNMDYCADFIEIGAREHLKETAFASIYRLGPAHYILASGEDLSAGAFQEKRFWQLPVNESDEPCDPVKARALAADFRSLLKSAVSLRLRSDVKVGSALSGGLDSSAIVLLMNELLREQGLTSRQETFSCVYSHPQTRSCDESGFINALAGKLQVKSNQIEPVEAEITQLHPEIIYMMDTPPDSTCISGWYTFQCAQENHVKVTLDGQGADEQLAGYLSYLLNFVSNSRQPLRDYLAFRKVRGAQRFAGAGLASAGVRRLLGVNAARSLHEMLRPRQFPICNPLNRHLAHDTLTELTTLLHYSDRASMAHSVESRVPFMDYRLVEFLASVPASYKLHEGWTKYLARLAFAGQLPDTITWRKDKMGWPVPERYWFTGPLNGYYTETISRSGLLRSLVDSGKVKRFQSSGWTSKSVRILNLAAWDQVFFSQWDKYSTRWSESPGVPSFRKAAEQAVAVPA